CFCS
ncbi:hypothetical protein CPC197_0576C, partial [Chlamydia psittaci C1/97]